jgi:hypothetical protein
MKVFWKTILRSGQCIGLSFLLIVLFGEVLARAQESSSKGAIVTYITGDVTYQNKTEQPEPSPVIAFMRMLQGDVLTLPAESEIKILFLKTGHQETWKGETVLKVEDTGCLVQKEEVWVKQDPPQVKSLMFQQEEAKAITNPSLPLPFRGVVPNVRAFPVLREFSGKKAAEIKKTHTELQEQFGSDDATSEFYRLSAFAKYGQYAEIQQIIKALLEKYPDNSVLKQWEEWAKKQEKSIKESSK